MENRGRKDASLMEKRAISQGVQVASRIWKSEAMDHLLEHPGAMQSCWHLFFFWSTKMYFRLLWHNATILFKLLFVIFLQQQYEIITVHVYRFLKLIIVYFHIVCTYMLFYAFANIICNGHFMIYLIIFFVIVHSQCFCFSIKMKCSLNIIEA